MSCVINSLQRVERSLRIKESAVVETSRVAYNTHMWVGRRCSWQNLFARVRYKPSLLSAGSWHAVTTDVTARRT